MTPLHHFGETLRVALLGIPLSAVRMLFVGSLVVLLAWVLCLPRERTTPDGRAARWDENLKLAAALALAVQIAIYAFL